jgi:hypothetical protein
MRNVCTEAGMAAIRVERDYAINEDFMQVRGVSPALFLLNVNIGGVRRFVSQFMLYIWVFAGGEEAHRRKEAGVQR